MDLVSLAERGFKYVNESYEWTWAFVDKRTDGRPFMQSVKPIIVMLCLYYSMVFFGPKIMRNRRPWKLKWVLITYNAFITILNFYIFALLAIGSYKKQYSWFCQPQSDSTDPDEMKIVNALYIYFTSKYIEFLDTFFFIVRKKNNQLSFLHVYHHSTMFFFWWLGSRWVPSGSAFLGPMINAFIHVLMYSYYGLSALGPEVRKYLWWKQYLTIIQLVQFTGGLVLGINAILTGCTFTRWMQYLLVFYMLSFMVLFGNFYRNAYKHGLRAAYRMEMKKRQLVITSNGETKVETVANGHKPAHQNGHVISANGDGLRARGKSAVSTISNGFLSEAAEEAVNIAKHGSS